MTRMRLVSLVFQLVATIAIAANARAETPTPLRLAWKENYLTVAGDTLPGGSLRILYLEAYCRPGSTERDWDDTMIGHTTQLMSLSGDATLLELECTL
jgi:hypothetical protein